MAAHSPLTMRLAEGLAEAVRCDEAGEGLDLSAGLVGAHVSAWLVAVASMIDPSHHIPQGSIHALPTSCTICHERQIQTPSGVSCPNGHGGADGYGPFPPIDET